MICSNRTILSILMSVTVLLIFSVVGCSDNVNETIISGGTSGGNAVSGAETYFPLNEGYTTVFRLTQSNGLTETITYKVGKGVNIRGLETHTWISSSNTVRDTGYFRAVSTALFYYDNMSSEPEKILELPLNPGQSWSRYEYSDEELIDPDNDFTDIITGDADQVDEDHGDGPSAVVGKNFPTEGTATMVAHQSERLELNTGAFFSDAIKISCLNNEANKANYYWFVPGIGLVKYVIGATAASYPNGDVVGELLDFGY